MACGHVGDGLQFGAGVDIARRVVGVADQYTLGARRDEPLELRDVGQAEAGLDGGGHGHDMRAGRYGERHVVGIRRFGHDDLVARVEACHEREEHCLRTAGGDDDLVGPDVEAAATVIFGEFDAQRLEALRRGVFEHLAVDVAQGLESLRGCGHVGLADVEFVDRDAAAFGGAGRAGKTAYGRGGHLEPAL